MEWQEFIQRNNDRIAAMVIAIQEADSTYNPKSYDFPDLYLDLKKRPDLMNHSLVYKVSAFCVKQFIEDLLELEPEKARKFQHKIGL